MGAAGAQAVRGVSTGSCRGLGGQAKACTAGPGDSPAPILPLPPVLPGAECAANGRHAGQHTGSEPGGAAGTRPDILTGSVCSFIVSLTSDHEAINHASIVLKEHSSFHLFLLLHLSVDQSPASISLPCTPHLWVCVSLSLAVIVTKSTHAGVAQRVENGSSGMLAPSGVRERGRQHVRFIGRGGRKRGGGKRGGEGGHIYRG